MRLSTKGRYATRILLCIARFDKEEQPVSKKRISEAEGISVDYIEQIIVPLKNAGLVRSIRGLRGGFHLSRTPEKISVLDILMASEGSVSLVGCLSDGCSMADSCVTQKVWRGASELLKDYFLGITLQDLLDDHAKLQEEKPLTFEI